MPKLKPATHQARRDHILDAAEHCFAQSGFHRTTMQAICKAASVSLGALYVHFDSKEALIDGLCQRDRAKLAANLIELAEAPDLMAALARLGERYAIEEPLYKRVLHVEIGAESTRNEKVGETFRNVDQFARSQFVQLFSRACDEGRIAPSVSPEVLADILCVIGDGLFWRRAVVPGFDPASVISTFSALLTGLINPRNAPPPPENGQRQIHGQTNEPHSEALS